MNVEVLKSVEIHNSSFDSAELVAGDIQKKQVLLKACNRVGSAAIQLPSTGSGQKGPWNFREKG